MHRPLPSVQPHDGLRRWRRLLVQGLFAFGLVVLAVFEGRAEERVLKLPDGRDIRYSVLDRGAGMPSALPTASRILTYLAQGRIDDAARHSNAPERRREVLEDYRRRVGEDEFRRVYGQYLAPENRVMAEVALGPHRLLVWQLGGAAGAVVGQYFVEVDGRFLMDDVPSARRQDLRRILEDYRGKAGREATPSRRRE